MFAAVRGKIENPIWYLGYGTNMNRGMFEGRRGMRPIRAQPALLENYRLCFNLPIGRGERGCRQSGASSGRSHVGRALSDYGRAIRASRSNRRCPTGAHIAGFMSASASRAPGKSADSHTCQTGSAAGVSPLRATSVCSTRVQLSMAFRPTTSTTWRVSICRHTSARRSIDHHVSDSLDRFTASSQTRS